MRKNIVLIKCERSAVRTQAVGGSVAPGWSLGQMSTGCGKIMMSSSM